MSDFSLKTQEQTRLDEGKVDWWHSQESTNFKIVAQMHLPRADATLVISEFAGLRKREKKENCVHNLQKGTVVICGPQYDNH